MIGSRANVRSLVDTNVVVYAYDPADTAKHQAAIGLLRDLSNAGLLIYSAQVFTESARIQKNKNRPGNPFSLRARR